MDIFLPLFLGSYPCSHDKCEPAWTRIGRILHCRPQPIHGNLKQKCLRILQIGIGRQIAVSLMRRELENL
jgi:hypothetical protein